MQYFSFFEFINILYLITNYLIILFKLCQKLKELYCREVRVVDFTH